MTDIKNALHEAMRIKGALAVSMVDYLSRMQLGKVETPFAPDLEVAACGNTDVVRAELDLLERLGVSPRSMEDIVISFDNTCHVIRPLNRRRHQGVFFYLILERSRGDLDEVRAELRRIEGELDI